jgi:hypothetical protein
MLFCNRRSSRRRPPLRVIRHRDTRAADRSVPAKRPFALERLVQQRPGIAPIALGPHGQVIGVLEEPTADHPLDVLHAQKEVCQLGDGLGVFGAAQTAEHDAAIDARGVERFAKDPEVVDRQLRLRDPRERVAVGQTQQVHVDPFIEGTRVA